MIPTGAAHSPADRPRNASSSQWIAPGEPWDLGHDDFDRSRYVGPPKPGTTAAKVAERWAAGMRAIHEEQMHGEGLDPEPEHDAADAPTNGANE